MIGAANGGGGGDDAGELSSELVVAADGDAAEPPAQSTLTSMLFETPLTFAAIVDVPPVVGAVNLVSNLPFVIAPLLGSIAPDVVYRLTLPCWIAWPSGPRADTLTVLVPPQVTLFGDI